MQYQESKESIELDFSPEIENPGRIFESFRMMFEHIAMFQTEVIKKVDPLFDVKFYLIDIRHGSLISDYIKKIIIPDSTDTEMIYPEPKGELLPYLNGAQDAVISTIAESPGRIIDNEILTEITNRIDLMAEETKVNQSQNFKLPNKIIVAESIELLEESTKKLGLNECYYLSRGNIRKQLTKVYTRFDKDELKRELAGKIIESSIHIKLKIKIADFLGKSRWKFKLSDGRTIEAKILDESWLERFHLKREVLGPGDSIEIKGFVKDTYDDYGKLIDSEYYITEVVKIHEANKQRNIQF